METLELTTPTPTPILTVPGELTLAVPAKSPLCWTVRDWQHQALRTVARDNGISVNRLVLGIWQGESYDFSKAEVYTSTTANHIMLLGDPDTIDAIRKKAKSLGQRTSPFMREVVFGPLGEAGKIAYFRAPTGLPIRTYEYMNMADREFRALKLCADVEGTDMAKIIMACIEGTHDRIVPLPKGESSRWKTVGVRPLPGQWLALREQSVAAHMRFPTYLRSLVFVGVGDN